MFYSPSQIVSFYFLLFVLCSRAVLPSAYITVALVSVFPPLIYTHIPVLYPNTALAAEYDLSHYSNAFPDISYGVGLAGGERLGGYGSNGFGVDGGD